MFLHALPPYPSQPDKASGQDLGEEKRKTRALEALLVTSQCSNVLPGVTREDESNPVHTDGTQIFIAALITIAPNGKWCRCQSGENEFKNC